jgi:arginyl-tRNA synthetase
MNLYQHVLSEVIAVVRALTEAGQLPPGLELGRITVEPARDPAHGDVATNVAMVLAGPAKMRPRDLALHVVERLRAVDAVASAEVAGPGFVNLRLRESFWHARLADIIRAGTAYGDSTVGAGLAVNVEYVSANPTGPLHVGHGRGAVVGDALSALLEKAGFRVTREYYVNDAGGQVDALARSLYQRYLVAVHALSPAVFDERRAAGDVAYAGEYLRPLADELAGQDGSRWIGATEAEWLPVFRDFAIERMMTRIEDDLAALGIRFQVVTSERRLVAAGAVKAAVNLLETGDLIYTGTLEAPKGKLPEDWEPRPQTLFRATRFGDEVDRPLMKSDGSWTYFAADIAYHLDKFRRGFPTMINIWGADHGGYVKRMQAAVAAITAGQGQLDVKLCQLVNLLDGGEPVKMSKRAGTFITLREVIDRVGRGVFRFIMLTRRNDAPLDFDFQLVTEQSRENPVFYVQYAHARCRSVLRHAAADLGPEGVSDEAFVMAALDRLTDATELDLIKTLVAWPRVVENAAVAHEPHRVAFYLQEVAALFHLLWNKGNEDARLRFIHLADSALTTARLALVRGTQVVLASGLAVIGVEPAEELR